MLNLLKVAGGGAGVIVTWCIGHLVEAVPPEGYGEQYKRWAIEQLPILPERWRVEPKAATAAQFKVVQQLVAKAGELVIATDADREGEIIDLGVEHKIVDKSGAWYAYNGNKIGQGKANACNFLRENPEIAADLEARIRAKELGGDAPAAEAPATAEAE